MKPVPGSTGNIEKRSLMVKASRAWVSRWAQKSPRLVWGVGFRLAVWLAKDSSGQFDQNSSFWGALGWKGAGLGILVPLYQA